MVLSVVLCVILVSSVQCRIEYLQRIPNAYSVKTEMSTFVGSASYINGLLSLTDADSDSDPDYDPIPTLSSLDGNLKLTPLIAM